MDSDRDGEHNDDSFETIILRFRDLGTSRGFTIGEHRKKIADHKHVWWGWWSKAGEAAPVRALTELKKQLPREVLLFHSGTDAVYRATCEDVRWGTDVMPSPEKSRTPKYYAAHQFAVWFKFSAITDTPAASPVLNSFSYVRRDEFFLNRKSRYTRFYGKRVSSSEELRLQDRTMWFVRGFDAKKDETNEVLLVSAHTVQPAHFPHKIEVSKHKTLLWLSDLHFAAEKGRHGFPLEEEGGTEWSLGSCVEDTLDRAHAKDLAGIIVSGDLTWKASKAEFQMARKFLTRITRSPAALDNYRVLVVPGNHDLAFASDPSKKGKPVTAATEAARKNFASFYQEMFFLPPNEFCSSGRRFLLGGAVAVDVVALNSSLLQQRAKHFQGQGFIGESQLSHAASAIGWPEQGIETRAFRIAVVHHHVMPVTFREKPMEGISYSVALDAEALIRWALRHRVDLIIHGHMHECFFARVKRRVEGSTEEHTVHVAGLGSSGVSADHRPDSVANYLGVLEFARRAVTLRMLPIVDKRGKSEGMPHEHRIEY